MSNWQRASAAQLRAAGAAGAHGQAQCGLASRRRRWSHSPRRSAGSRRTIGLRKSLAIAQSRLGQHEQAYATIEPYLAKNRNDTDALMVALQAIYQVHSEGKIHR